MNTDKNENREGVTMLGNSKMGLPDAPQKNDLEAFENHFSHRDYTIKVDCPDFTSLCPVTGQPDFAHIKIQYIPSQKCVETKSLKLYLGAFRNTRAFNEEVVNKILDDLVSKIEPKSMTVIGEFSSRGGISLTVTGSYPNRVN